MTTTCAEYRILLAEAKAKLAGGQAIEIRSGEKQVKYGAIDKDYWRREVARLQRYVDACDGVRSCGRVIRFIPTDG